MKCFNTLQIPDPIVAPAVIIINIIYRRYLELSLATIVTPKCLIVGFETTSYPPTVIIPLFYFRFRFRFLNCKGQPDSF